MQTSLERIAKKSKENDSYRFRNLYQLINEELLLECWKKLNKRSAAGIDDITVRVKSSPSFQGVKSVQYYFSI